MAGNGGGMQAQAGRQQQAGIQGNPAPALAAGGGSSRQAARWQAQRQNPQHCRFQAGSRRRSKAAAGSIQRHPDPKTQQQVSVQRYISIVLKVVKCKRVAISTRHVVHKA